MYITTTTLSRAAGICAIIAGLIFGGIQFIHPVDEAASVPTTMWAVTGYLTFTMAVCGMVAVTGLYLRQVQASGILGLVGALMLGIFYLLTSAFTFAETLILPAVAGEAPRFVENFLGIFNGAGTDGTLGALEVISPVAGGLYLLGGVVFGLASLRAGIFPRWASILLALGAIVPVLTAFLPHAVNRFAALPVGIALIGLGLFLWAQRAPAPVESEPRLG
ncbi:hypothetical protein [Ruania rhizosphaerae]|uniref:hypothetical protein n=1 Tax=Ruania rhizosphaerae TaxID=1840413 RepID=UPI001356B0E7|nr:hypothetical protein [Ruania rhizosphaerae]